jgi:branched-chain amino acid transport system ATP-binding protein
MAQQPRINGHGATMLLVEQNAYQALYRAQRAYVLENGEAQLEGPARELAGNPLVKEAYLGGYSEFPAIERSAFAA